MRIIENVGEDKVQAIRYAIENGFTIVFFYEGKDYRERKAKGENPVRSYRRVEPFAIGKTTAGDWVFRGYQYVGATNSKNQVYKLFRVDEIKGKIQLVYDKSGEKIRSYEPRQYIDDRGVEAKYNELGDYHMKQGVDTKFDPDMEHLAGIEPTKTEPKPEVEPKPTEPTEPTKIKPGIKPGLQQKPEPVKNKPQIQEPTVEPEEPEQTVQTTEPEIEKPEDQEDEWEPQVEPIKESSGFYKWFLKLNYESK